MEFRELWDKLKYISISVTRWKQIVTLQKVGPIYLQS
jgi:hypothetical protein